MSSGDAAGGGVAGSRRPERGRRGAAAAAGVGVAVRGVTGAGGVGTGRGAGATTVAAWAWAQPSGPPSPSRRALPRPASMSRRRAVRRLAQDRRPGAGRPGAVPRGEQALDGLRPRRHPSTADPVGDPAAAVGELAPPERDAPQRDVQRPQQQREHEQPRPQLGELARGLEVVDPRRRRACPARGRRSPPRIAASSGSFAPRSRYSAAVGATRPSVRPSGASPACVCVTRTA